MEKNLYFATFPGAREALNDRCDSDRLYEQLVMAVCDLEGFAADASQVGNDRAAEILLATANVLRSVIPIEFSTAKN
jgi:hypothetical protein